MSEEEKQSLFDYSQHLSPEEIEEMIYKIVPHNRSSDVFAYLRQVLFNFEHRLKELEKRLGE